MRSGAVPVSPEPAPAPPGRSPPYLPFCDGPPDTRPRLKPIPVARWLSPDTEAQTWLPAKRALIRQSGHEVAAGELDGPEARELLALMRAELPEGDFGAMGSHLERAAWAVSDDLCLLRARRPGDWRLIAGVLCAPTYWTIRERIGMDLGALHGPVPDGDPGLAQRIGRVFSGLRPGRVLERFNWTVQLGGAHHTPERPVAGHGGDEALYLRVERQTLRTLPVTGAVVFTIRICLDPLPPLLVSSALREKFEDAWLGASRPLRAYKAWPELEGRIAQACRDAQRTGPGGLIDLGTKPN